MQRFARLDGSLVVEIVEIPDGIAIEDAFHSSLIFVAATQDAAVGMIYMDGAFAIYEPPIVDVRASKLAELTAACSDAIAAGYSSSALGAAHLYPSRLTDQSNMQASVIRSLLPGLATDWTTPFWCADEAGEWARRDHTAAQIQQAGQDGVAHVLAQQDKLALLAADVAAASTAEAIAAIVWTDDAA